MVAFVVGLQFMKLSKGFFTQVAFVWFLSSMCSNVKFQVMRNGEFLAAIITLEWFGTGVK